MGEAAPDLQLVRDLTRIETKIDERDRSAESFRGEMRASITDIRARFDAHAANDDRRFEQADLRLQKCMTDIYTDIEQRAREGRRLAWQIFSIGVAVIGFFSGVIMFASKLGFR